MPFTFAHPAAIIPIRRFARRSTSLSALAIGSMSPDFVYYLPLHISGSFTHSAFGLVLFCLPASLVVYVVFHAFARQPLIALLPETISSRLNDTSPEWKPRTLIAFALIAISVLVGAATHVLWDAFTHSNTDIVRNSGFLRSLVGPRTHAIPVYKLLQHASSVFGLAVLTGSVFRWIEHTPPIERRHRLPSRYRIAIGTGIVIAGLVSALFGINMRSGAIFERAIFYGVVGFTVGAMTAILLFCAGRHLRTYRMRCDSEEGRRP